MKFGGAERVQQLQEHMKAVGRDNGIAFSYDGVISNTFESHRLIQWAQQTNHQSTVVEEIYALYFEQDKDISDIDNLVVAAERAGLDSTETRAFLKSDSLVEDVKQLLLASKAHGVNGVPDFIVGDKYQVSGAQEPETFVAVFEQVLKKMQQ
ncbi:thioredoxin-like protein [Hesseltinella vesiculosa]|uniref:Thioredoxin-like protein n=1 Tax=Hesseltinella vesiculosa TaxID=101127 RepID=A0A1X2GDP9_9FUNG|nr:thioredoxin-like protein [Hesseltinella vesiculosa]